MRGNTPRTIPRWPSTPICSAIASCSRASSSAIFARSTRDRRSGSLWTLALPVTLMLVYLVVFSVMWKSPTTDVDHYWLFLLCGLPPWVFFATSVQSSARSLLENASLIRKVRFPRQLVPLSIVATQLVAFVVMTGIVIVLAMIVLPDSRSTAWLAIPIGAVIVLFVSGVSLAVASANAIYRDIEFVVAALLLPLFFLTPVLYSLDNLPGADAHPWLLDLLQWGNPLTPLVECFRAPLFLGEVPSTADLVYLVVETIVALALGAFVFTSVDDRIAAEV